MLRQIVVIRRDGNKSTLLEGFQDASDPEVPLVFCKSHLLIVRFSQ